MFVFCSERCWWYGAGRHANGVETAADNDVAAESVHDGLRHPLWSDHTGRNTHSVSGACREGITTRVGTLTLSVGHVGKG